MWLVSVMLCLVFYDIKVLFLVTFHDSFCYPIIFKNQVIVLLVPYIIFHKCCTIVCNLHGTIPVIITKYILLASFYFYELETACRTLVPSARLWPLVRVYCRGKNGDIAYFSSPMVTFKPCIILAKMPLKSHGSERNALCAFFRCVTRERQRYCGRTGHILTRHCGEIS